MIGMMITLTPSDLHLIRILYYTRERLLKDDVTFSQLNLPLSFNRERC